MDGAGNVSANVAEIVGNDVFVAFEKRLEKNSKTAVKKSETLS